jgi:hypothetical protein
LMIREGVDMGEEIDAAPHIYFLVKYVSMNWSMIPFELNQHTIG